jgi:hypothetical protein
VLSGVTHPQTQGHGQGHPVCCTLPGQIGGGGAALLIERLLCARLSVCRPGGIQPSAPAGHTSVISHFCFITWYYL